MKKSSEIVGLSLIGIKEGVELGKVCELVLDPGAKQVRYLVIDCGEGAFGYKVLDLGCVTGIGEDYVITGTLNDVEPIWQNAEALELNYSSRYVVGANVIACAGNIIGKIGEFIFDESTGKIDRLIIDEPKGDVSEISGPQAVALAKRQIFVDLNAKPPLDDETPEPVEESQFEKEERQYMLGRVIGANIADANGKLIARKGDKVTNEIINRAKAANKYVDLTMSVD